MRWLPIKEVCELINASDMTVRRYIQRHGQYIRTRQRGNITEIAEESIPVLRKIRQFYMELRWNRHQVEEALAENFAMNVVIAEDEDRGAITVKQTLEDMQHMRQILWRLVEENRMLREEFELLRQKLEEKERQEASQRVFLEREFQEVKESLSRVERYRQKKGWIRRLFDPDK